MTIPQAEQRGAAACVFAESARGRALLPGFGGPHYGSSRSKKITLTCFDFACAGTQARISIISVSQTVT